ncbi:MAG: sulfite exporter TauE/SafE family protein [Gammaproteobacteria bacterium]|nr:sulfite exporter TauE/SafE family protein [Gammaproteobacteria bacterium]MCW8910790.1 sulfite exporter TauE/SafE family protein [Gammaproteobacteria bacterium]MCW9004170.1 sulfite exporter TauE/SafE family protein [Gammaproteobacteria bacterium]MCW9055517.1 sulfite exporter TauE/SafE family protein [Gammaproteobacteria bacterium]
MIEEFSYFSAFVIGLMSGVHCVGMCGGIVGALSMGVNKQIHSSSSSYFSMLLAYNFGRILSYTLAGALMGGIGWMLSHWLMIRNFQLVLQFIAALMMIFLGLYLSGWWTILRHIERLGALLWQRIEPVSKKLLPVSCFSQALILGVLWGWLPCGLVYSVLVWSVSTGDFQQGALLMLFFGLGTLPNLLAMGLFVRQLTHLFSRIWVRRFAGSLIICFGLSGLYQVMAS